MDTRLVTTPPFTLFHNTESSRAMSTENPESHVRCKYFVLEFKDQIGLSAIVTAAAGSGINSPGVTG
jgi:hypothetical protein